MLLSCCPGRLFTYRDVAIVPFYGNSIATRVPAITLTGSSNGSSTNSSSMCWPPFFCGGSSERKSAAVADILVLGDFRAAQRVCLKLKLTQAAPHKQQQCSREELEESIRQQMLGNGVSTQQQQQQQQGKQQGDVMDVWLVNTHLDHASPAIRARQMQVRLGAGAGGSREGNVLTPKELSTDRGPGIGTSTIMPLHGSSNYFGNTCMPSHVSGLTEQWCSMHSQASVDPTQRTLMVPPHDIAVCMLVRLHPCTVLCRAVPAMIVLPCLLS